MEALRAAFRTRVNFRCSSTDWTGSPEEYGESFHYTDISLCTTIKTHIDEQLLPCR